jgi:hypothetical protein
LIFPFVSLACHYFALAPISFLRKVTARLLSRQLLAADPLQWGQIVLPDAHKVLFD